LVSTALIDFAGAAAGAGAVAAVWQRAEGAVKDRERSTRRMETTMDRVCFSIALCSLASFSVWCYGELALLYIYMVVQLMEVGSEG
jgi:hypothetical protein